MENRNVIETVVHTALTKRELVDLINKSFPDEEVGNHGTLSEETIFEFAMCKFKVL